MVARKPSPAQFKALTVIAAGGVRTRSMGARFPIGISGPAGTIAENTYDSLLRNGWAERDLDFRNNWGYDVLITNLGRSFLPGEEAVEVAEVAEKEVAEEVAAPAVAIPVAAAGPQDFEDFEEEVDEGDFEPESEEDVYEQPAPPAPVVRRVHGFEDIETDGVPGPFQDVFEEQFEVDTYEQV